MATRKSRRFKRFSPRQLRRWLEDEGQSLQWLRDRLVFEYGVESSPGKPITKSAVADWARDDKHARPNADAIRALVEISGRELDYFYE